MGIVFKQSLNNTIITYFGFGIGAINTLFLYTRFLTDEYFGLVGVILSTSTILAPLLAFGVPNTLIKYYSSFTDAKTLDSFLTLMLLLPLLLLLPIAVFSYLANDVIADFLARENAIVKGYVWHIFFIGMAMAYFEVFYSWSKVQLKSIFGNFMKEVFVRAGVTILLILVYLNTISVETFLMSLVGLYLLRTVIMKIYAYGVRMPQLSFSFPANTRAILAYSALIILGASTAVIVLEIDRFMINQYIEIKNVAYYSVAIYIAVVISVPSRAMHQITYPLTAKLLNEKDTSELGNLYKKSSLTLFIAAGLIFILILLNLEDLYHLLPAAYRGGFFVVALIGLAKVYDALLGNNNAILFSSDYYKTVLILGFILALMTILFNMWFIPSFGIEGAAMATFLAVFLYNTIKVIFVRLKFSMSPFSPSTFKIALLLIFITILFSTLQFPFHPIANILLKSFLMTLMYFGVIYRLRLSEEVFEIISRLFSR